MDRFPNFASSVDFSSRPDIQPDIAYTQQHLPIWTRSVLSGHVPDMYIPEKACPHGRQHCPIPPCHSPWPLRHLPEALHSCPNLRTAALPPEQGITRQDVRHGCRSSKHHGLPADGPYAWCAWHLSRDTGMAEWSRSNLDKLGVRPPWQCSCQCAWPCILEGPEPCPWVRSSKGGWLDCRSRIAHRDSHAGKILGVNGIIDQSMID